MDEFEKLWQMVTCPYSKNGVCAACRILRIKCDGERFINCEQYIMTKKKDESHG